MKLTPEQILQLEEETVLLCQEMIRIPSVNYGEGKGDEKAMAEYVASKLSEVGIKSELIETAPNRVNVVAHIEGRDKDRPGLVLHGHIDVVPVNADDWSVDPFGGIIKNGFIWGRGAVDMKDMDAMILASVRMWQRIGYKPQEIFCWFSSLMKRQDLIMDLAGWSNIGRNCLKVIAKQFQR